MADSVELNAGDNKSEVAFRMARNLWNATERGAPYENDNKSDFLDLVQECVCALSIGGRV